MTAEEDVDRVLRAAAAPARPEELAGEQTALAAFRQAHLADAPTPRRQSMFRLALAKLFTAKVAAVTVAVGAAGGAALAATGNLPSGAVGGLGAAPATVQPSEPASPATHPASPATHPAPPATHPAAGVGSERPGQGPVPPSPSPSIKGLCQAYVAGADDRERAQANPAFRGLIRRAGGEDEVGAYCADLLSSPPVPGGQPSSGPPGNRPDPGRTPPADPGPPGDRVGPPSVPPTGR